MNKKLFVEQINSLENRNVFTDLDNLLMNMSSGLLPEHLSVREIELLTEKYGDDWFDKLGYTEPQYVRPRLNAKGELIAK